MQSENSNVWQKRKNCGKIRLDYFYGEEKRKMKAMRAEKKILSAENGMVFLVVLLLMGGFFWVRDYGISFDEGTEFNTMKLTFQYADYVIAHLLGADVVDYSGFTEYADNIYGVAVRYPLYLLAAKVPMSVRTFFLVTHYYTYFWFCGAVAALYYLVRRITGKKWLAALGAIMLICSPRIAGEAFYNIKDSMFFSLFLISLAAGYYYIKQRRTSGLALFTFLSALCINTRYIGGIVLLFVALQFALGEIRKGVGIGKGIWGGLKICFLCYVFYFLMTPFLWENPLVNTWRIIASFSDYGDGIMSMMYCGKIYFSDNLPWHYLIVWILITTPVMVTVLYLAENAYCIKRMISLRREEIKTFLANEDNLFSFFVGSIVWITIAADIILQPIKYDGWRHFYFLYGPFLFTAIMGVHHLTEWTKGQAEKTKCKTVAENVCLGMVILSCVANFFWIVGNQPYEYLYFNPLCRGMETEFERDYWYVSTYDAVEEILRMDDSDEIQIYCVCKTVTLFLEEVELSRVEFVDDMASADYVILQYRAATVEEWKALCENMQMVSEKQVDGLPIYTIYSAQ
ncbi:MAG: glycosyltransferase family 39 protein [Lachnospiraceae bacterium]|nr:glycosyltransferase family 39 protein [Lachnospiraceae bacterium]